VSGRLQVRRAAPRPERPGPEARPPKRRRLLFAVLGTALVAALGGCSLLGLSTDSDSGSSIGGEAGSASPGGSPLWFWAQQGQKTASPAGPALPALTTPGAGAPATPGPVNQPTYSVTPYCLTRLRADTMNWLNATPGVGQASVSWMSLGDPRIVEYKIAAVLQNRPGGSVPPATWTTIPKPNGCQQVNATISGLTSGNWYVFWLDVVVTTLPTGRREPMIGRSPAFKVL